MKYAKQRSMLRIPVLVATALTAGLALLMKRVVPGWTWADAGSVLFCVWPPTVAAVHAVQDRLPHAA